MKQIKIRDECISRSMYISPKIEIINVGISDLLQGSGTGGSGSGDGDIIGAKKSNNHLEESDSWEDLY